MLLRISIVGRLMTRWLVRFIPSDLVILCISTVRCISLHWMIWFNPKRGFVFRKLISKETKMNESIGITFISWSRYICSLFTRKYCCLEKMMRFYKALIRAVYQISMNGTVRVSYPGVLDSISSRDMRIWTHGMFRFTTMGSRPSSNGSQYSSFLKWTIFNIN